MKKKETSDWQGKVAVVTGASSGIGEAIAMRLAQEGLHVVLVARRLERLNQVRDAILSQGGSADVIVADLEKEEDCQMVHQAALQCRGRVDVLVNNAGFGWYGYYGDMAWDTAQAMIRLNIEAVARLTNLFLGSMQAQGSGHIVNVGSIAGSFPNQGVTAYSASKAFVSAFSTALYRELQGSPVHVTLVLPGPVSTEFFEQAASRKRGLRIPAERLAISPQRVARRAWQVLLRPRRVVYVPAWLGIVPWVELYFGWIIDRLGPLLLRRASTRRGV